jgi:hypothetical protein
MKIPKKGDKIYVPTSLHISRGSDDVQGGLATIESVEISEHLPAGHYNSIMVSVKEVPGVGYNYTHLLEIQEKLAKEFGENAAYPDPDVDTPWIEEGDIVDGKPYNGSPIW